MQQWLLNYELLAPVLHTFEHIVRSFLIEW